MPSLNFKQGEDAPTVGDLERDKPTDKLADKQTRRQTDRDENYDHYNHYLNSFELAEADKANDE